MMIDPRFVEIPDSILQVVPKSVMLEHCVLPLKDDGKSLTLLCPPDPEFPASEGEKLRFILGRDITFLAADEELLRDAIEKFIPPSEGTVENCEPRFRFKCPKNWTALKETADRRVRFCSECQKEVHWCNTSAAATELGRQGKCVALYTNEASTTGMIDFGNKSDP